jgi:hypothetical protein
MTTPVAPIFDTAVVGDDVIIDTGEFWPDVSLHDFKSSMRIIDKNDAPVIGAMNMGIFEVNTELAIWQAVQAALGYATLADVPSPNANLVSAYQQAVYCCSKGKLLDLYRDMDTTNSGHDRADDLEKNALYYYAEFRRLVRLMKGETMLTAALL